MQQFTTESNRHQRAQRTIACAALAAVTAMLIAPQRASAQWDTSPAPILQWFESSYQTIENRMPDYFMAGYGAVWMPPPGRADLSDFSVGYDVYDRFDLGYAGRETLYGTATGFRRTADMFHRAGAQVGIDLIINHNGFSDTGTPGFVTSGGYPGFLMQDPNGDPFGQPSTDGDFNSAFDYGDLRGRLAGLVDIDHATNFRFIRHPVPGFEDPVAGEHGGNLPNAGITPDGAGRLANVALESNRQFYPDRDGPSIDVFDPVTGESGIKVYSFNTSDPSTGDPVGENVTGYLMRYAQWMVQVNGVDQFRIDAAKHIEGFALDFFDRSVYRQNPRTLLDGSTNHVFSYSETFDGNKDFLQTFVKKNINDADPGRIGGNRDTLDFPLYFALRDNLTGNGFQNDWHNVRNATLDIHDDGLHNGSQGVMFVNSHDDHGPELSNVAHAYMLMHPGNAVVYFNAKEHGDNRDFPKDGRGDALGGVFGSAITDLVRIRNTHGRGNYAERWIEKEIFAFERVSSAITLLNNRTDSGYDSRTLTHVGFAPGTHLIELTGNASRANTDPFNDIPEVITVFEEGGVNKVNVRFLRNSSDGQFHANGYLVYGLPTPVAPSGLELFEGVDSVIPGGNSDTSPFANGTTRLTDINVVKGDLLKVRLQTVEVNLLGSIRDVWADGDNALLKLDDGRPINLDGGVDFVTPGTVTYGFERFGNKSNPLIGPEGLGGSRGDGEFIQHIDTTGLEEGFHFLEARAFRHRTDGGPPVYSEFKQVFYVDRFKPVSDLDSFDPWDDNFQENRDLIVRSLDFTADNVHVFKNLGAAISDEDVIAMVGEGNRAGRWDRDLFKFAFFGLEHGNNALTVVTFEITGTSNVQRFGGVFTSTINGRGLGDTNFDGFFSASDIGSASGAFEEVLYSQNQQFNAASDINGDGWINNMDLFLLETPLLNGGADQSTLDEYYAVLDRRGNMNQQFGTDAFDIDHLYNNLGSTDWLFDLSDNGVADQMDVDLLVRLILNTEFGDANLDGVVGLDDLLTVLATINGSGPGPMQAITSAGWINGDFNGDGVVDSLDQDILAFFWDDPNLSYQQALEQATGIPTPAALPCGLILLAVCAARRRRQERMPDVRRADEPCDTAYSTGSFSE